MENDYKETASIIKRYIQNEKANYAILVDGEWGVGKTHFIKKLVNDINSNKEIKDKKAIYITLYGLSSTEAITDQIYIWNKRFKEIKGNISNVSFGNIPVGEIAKGVATGVNKLITLFVKDIKDKVLIFDDLERCNICINEVLGYINDFVEHKQVKVIIVANEKKINKVNLKNNLELKYLVALNDKDDDESKTIEERVENIFSQDTVYKQIKEKLIGNTIYYEPNLEQVVNNIIDEYFKKSDELIKKVVRNNKKFLISFFETKRYCNIRTINFIYEKFEELAKEVLKIEIIKDYEEKLLEVMFKDCVKLGVGFKSKYFTHTVEFEFIDDFIKSSKLNLKLIETMIQNYIKNQSSSLKNWFLYSELEVVGRLQQLEVHIKNNFYPVSRYPDIIVSIMQLEELGFDVNLINNIILEMKNNMVHEEEIASFKRYANMTHDELSNRASDRISEACKQKIMQHLDDLSAVQETVNFEKVAEINNFFQSSVDYGTRFLEAVMKNEIPNNLFNFVDIDKIIECIEKSNNQNLADLQLALNSIDFFIDNKKYREFVQKLNYLQSNNSFDKIKRFRLHEFIEVVNRKKAVVNISC